MTGKQRVRAAMEFRECDRVPRFLSAFSPEFRQAWKSEQGDIDPAVFCGTDMAVVAADETAWPTRARVVEDDGEQRIVRSGWGWLERRRSGAKFAEMFDLPVPERIDPDSLVFDDPFLDSRYTPAGQSVARLRDDTYVLCKTGGPYLRAAMMRGERDFWIDIAEDAGWVRAYVDRVTEHIAIVGVESLRRFGLQDTGIAIYDDVAANWGPFVSPQAYEQIFLPALHRMVEAYRAAGAKTVMLHSDGDVSPLLEMWIDAGIQAIHPLEFRAGMDPVRIKEQYGDRLVCIGGLCNSQILPRGDPDEIRRHVRHLLRAAEGGGFVFSTAEIGGDVSPQTIRYLVELLDDHR